MEEERQEVQNNKSAKVLSRVNSDSIETPPEETMILRQALLSSNLQPSAQIKVNELLYQWLSLPQTRYLVNDLAQECILRKETDFHNGSNLQNEDIGQGTANGCCSNLSATYNNMELEVKESEQQPKYHKLDEKLLLENQTLRKAAVAAASLDSHPPLSPCTSSDSPRQEKSPITPSRRSKTLLSTNGSKPSSNPSTTVKSHDTPTNQIETKESSRDSHISNYSIPQFYFPGDPRAQHRHAIEARMRCRARRKSKQEHEPTKGIETVLSSKESKVGNSGDNDRKILHYENLLKTEELSGSDIDENFFVKYLPEIRKDLLQIFDTGKGTSIGISLDDFAQVTKEFCGFPSFFAEPLALRVRELWNEKLKREDKSFIPRQKEEEIRITMDQFEHFWHTEMEPYDRYTRFFRLVKQRKNEHIFPEDFEKFLNELLTFHPGLEFLHETEEFQVGKLFFDLPHYLVI
ncbi:MAG: hypothetical protein CMI56_00240 [Parcubacteria group bacterium]|nr:hypothetical protein [Parcubacteria group bacterium]